MSIPKLIITADDYGMSPRFNQGIIDLTRKHLVTGISVMILQKYICVQELFTLQTPLGLHLELEENSIENDIRAQVNLFRKRFGILPVYLDGHQHQHLTPQHLQNTLRVAREFRIPVRSRFSADREIIRRAGVLTPDNFISWHPTRISILEGRLEDARQFQTSELVCHPGYSDPDCPYPYNAARELELTFLKSSTFREFLSGYSLGTYQNLSG